MQNLKITKIILMNLIILIIIFLLLLYMKTHAVVVLSKNEAIRICKEVMYTKVDKKLSTLFKVSNYKENKDKIIINLYFNNVLVNKKYKKENKITTAQCVFLNKYNNQEEVNLKSFFYQDVSKNVYIFYNTMIKIKLYD